MFYVEKEIDKWRFNAKKSKSLPLANNSTIRNYLLKTLFSFLYIFIPSDLLSFSFSLSLTHTHTHTHTHIYIYIYIYSFSDCTTSCLINDNSIKVFFSIFKIVYDAKFHPFYQVKIKGFFFRSICYWTIYIVVLFCPLLSFGQLLDSVFLDLSQPVYIVTQSLTATDTSQGNVLRWVWINIYKIKLIKW